MATTRHTISARLGVAAWMTWAALAAGACGGEDSGRPEPDTSSGEELVDDCRRVDQLELDVIEDFELGTASLVWVSSDGTGTIEPASGSNAPATTTIPGGRCGTSSGALQIQAEGLTRYGGAFGVSFVPEPVDASDWDGLSLWARRGPDSNETLFVAVSEQHTDEMGGALVREDEEPFCLEEPLDPIEKCDRFGAAIGLDETWQLYLLPFDDLRQRGFGRPAPFLDRSALLGLNVSFETGDWNLFIDDLSFYRKR